ncbi:hypothetical protein GCM10010116_55570 [Microbispora rosea subsp. aerata]|nr:hypothetical protein [Microbispora rosea]GGO27726.1 hypothetical protein GCM10010116_55570 [Microbispora rosea subsp. aerata]GIH56940.1 hypothetical protein Mro02_38540 [Microbispora rosea subsp. aerata]GLJ82866.1 hypothetical protein GCM10017588_15920 [Microbispora rosea subsp. aerata]
MPLAREKRYAPDAVERAWKVLDAFGGFGFCKTYAAAFALPTYPMQPQGRLTPDFGVRPRLTGAVPTPEAAS